MSVRELGTELEKLSELTYALDADLVGLQQRLASTQEAMMSVVRFLEIRELLADLEDCSVQFARCHYESATAREARETAKDVYDDALLEFEIAWKRAQTAPEPDPLTGKANKDWSERLLQQAVMADSGLSELSIDLAEAESGLVWTQANLAGQEARFSAVRHRARLVAGMLVFLAEPTATLGRLGAVVKEEG